MMSEEQEQLEITVEPEKWLNEALFLRHRFSPTDSGRWSATVVINQTHALMEFEVFDTHPELGVNVEQRINGVLYLSAYVHDEDDFTKLFGV